MSKSKVMKLLNRVGVPKEMLYMDIGETALPPATEFRYPAPNSQEKKINFAENFPLKAEQLSKAGYGAQRAAILAKNADADAPLETTTERAKFFYVPIKASDVNDDDVNLDWGDTRNVMQSQ